MKYRTVAAFSQAVGEYVSGRKNKLTSRYEKGKLYEARQTLTLSGLLAHLGLTDAAWADYVSGRADGLPPGECPESEVGTYRQAATEAMRTIKADIIEKMASGELDAKVGQMLLKSDFGYGAEADGKVQTININLTKNLEAEAK